MSTKVRVNLREMYPKYYNQECFVEVDQDVYETMNKYDHIDAVYKRKVDYHKGYFSLDRSPFLELEKEGFDVNENILLKELISFIELTIKDLLVKEKERILKKYVQCKTLESIAIEENWSILAVYYSIKIALKKIKEVLIKNGYDIND
ncbi:MAG TPA: hypothetical protein OIL79_02370 [Coprobacillaceae bacterium]|nr:hypothetical protein [Coprobacillaceae bacterium]